VNRRPIPIEELILSSGEDTGPETRSYRDGSVGCRGGEVSAHTYLFEEGVWDVSGVTTTGTGPRETTGETRVVHWPGVWLVEQKLRGATDDDTEVETSIEATPLADDADHTTWTAFSSVLGKQTGHFVVIDDTILSVFECADDGPRGTEVLRQLDDETYESIGALFAGTKRVATWSLQLARRRQ
jgi:hypothetical protein